MLASFYAKFLEFCFQNLKTTNLGPLLMLPINLIMKVVLNRFP